MKYILMMILLLVLVGCVTPGPTTNTLGYEGTQVFPELGRYTIHIIRLEDGSKCLIPQHDAFYFPAQCLIKE